MKFFYSILFSIVFLISIVFAQVGGRQGTEIRRAAGGGETTAIISNAANNPNLVTNILGAGTVTVTSNNLGTFTVTGTGGNPAGTSGAVQFNHAGAFAGTNDFVFDRTNSGLFIQSSSALPANPRAKLILTNQAENVRIEYGLNRISANVALANGFGINWGNDAPDMYGTNILFIIPTSMRPGVSNSMDWGHASTPIRTLYASSLNTLAGLTLASNAGVGKVLVSDADGVGTWGTNLNNILVTNLTIVNETIFRGPVTFNTNVFITNLFLGGIALRTNQYTTNVSFTPVLGSLFFGGTVGSDMTNGSRVGMEYIPARHSFRVGALGPQASVSNYWDSTNVGIGSFAQGSNVLAVGHYAAVHGIFNRIGTNSDASSIMGGSNNFILTNVFAGHIGGGHENDIGDNHVGATIGGGTGNTIDTLPAVGTGEGTIAGGNGNRVRFQHGAIGGGFANDARDIGSTIAGGINNVVQSGSYGFLGGGEQNQIAGDWAVGGGGTLNIIQAASTGNDGQGSGIFAGVANRIGASTIGSDYAVIVGGRSNNIPNASDYSFIGGGSFNQVGGGATGEGSFIGGGFNNLTDDTVDYAAIAGGKKNTVSGDLGAILGGASNNITVAYAYVSGGSFVTNSTTKSVELGWGSEGGNNRKLRVDVNGARVLTYNGSATVGGTYLITNTPIASAGASETNLHVVTIGAHVLTNNNDRLLVRGSGRFAATSNTKQIQVVFGSEDVFDSGAFVANTGAYTVDCEIIRIGNTSQSCNCSFNGGTNVVYVRTSSLDLAQTNGIATVLKITGTASGNGDITNRTLTVEWRPST